MSETQATAEELNKELEKQISVIDEAIESAKAGDIKELEGLDEDVESICASIEQADPEIANQTRETMSRMIARLEDLARILQDHQAGTS